MKVCLEWLNAIIEVKDIPIKTFEDRMIMSGSKVEVTELLGVGIENVVIGQITAIEKHPAADKLVVCQINVGKETVQIVTGATNVFVGAVVPVALVGAKLPGDKAIGLSQFRGLDSQGMLCSLEELGFEDSVIPKKYVDGIFIINDKVTLGENALTALGIKDAVVEFEITPNRSDCLSMIGMARETSATFDRSFQYSNTVVTQTYGTIEGLASLEVLDSVLCPRLAMRVVKNVKV